LPSQNEATVTEIKPIDPFAIQDKELDLGMRGKFTFRELTVKENDAARETATAKDGTFNGRTMMRMMVTMSAVEPKISLEQLEKLPQRVYAAIVEFVNDLNDAESLTDEGEPGND
jgi:hypothetical protein